MVQDPGEQEPGAGALTSPNAVLPSFLSRADELNILKHGMIHEGLNRGVTHIRPAGRDSTISPGKASPTLTDNASSPPPMEKQRQRSSTGDKSEQKTPELASAQRSLSPPSGSSSGESIGEGRKEGEPEHTPLSATRKLKKPGSKQSSPTSPNQSPALGSKVCIFVIALGLYLFHDLLWSEIGVCSRPAEGSALQSKRKRDQIWQRKN